MTLSYRGLCWWAIGILILILTIARFTMLEKSPPGFYVDEAILAAHTLCLGQTGHDADGRQWPLFSQGGGGGVVSPTYLYPAALWSQIFGSSIQAFRGFAAFKMSLAIIGLFFFARIFLGNRGALFVALAACLSPWMFVFARMALDDPTLMLVGLAWGLFFFVRSRRYTDAFASAFFFSVALYAYPPGRALIPLLFVPLFFLRTHRLGFERQWLGSFVVAGLIFCGPLIMLTLRGALSARYGVVGIIGSTPREDLVRVFIANYLKHLEWNYLFVRGDANLRHSIQASGQWSWLDIFALTAGLMMLAWMWFRKKRPWHPLIVFALVGYLLSMIPPALTWESLPHSLRSLGCWPFLALLTGATLATLEKRASIVLIPVVGLALGFSLYFGSNYFFTYPQVSLPWFDAGVKAGALNFQPTGDWRSFTRQLSGYDTRAARYYIMHYGQKTCEESVHF